MIASFLKMYIVYQSHMIHLINNVNMRWVWAMSSVLYSIIVIKLSAFIEISNVHVMY